MKKQRTVLKKYANQTADILADPSLDPQMAGRADHLEEDGLCAPAVKVKSGDLIAYKLSPTDTVRDISNIQRDAAGGKSSFLLLLSDSFSPPSPLSSSSPFLLSSSTKLRFLILLSGPRV